MTSTQFAIHRFLLGDHLGNVKVLILQMTGDRVTDLKLEWLGVTSWPSCLTYLDNGVVYVGSRMGDPMLVRLNAEKGASAHIPFCCYCGLPSG
jgi:DNA damage-binding protein 1